MCRNQTVEGRFAPPFGAPIARNCVLPRTGRVQVFHFPKLGIFIEVTGHAEASARLETRIPDDLFFGQFNDADWSSVSQAGLSPFERSRRRHEIRNRMQIAGLSLEMLQRQADDGDLDLLETLEMVIESLSALEESC